MLPLFYALPPKERHTGAELYALFFPIHFLVQAITFILLIVLQICTRHFIQHIKNSKPKSEYHIKGGIQQFVPIFHTWKKVLPEKIP